MTKTYTLDIETTMDHNHIWVCGLKELGVANYVHIQHPKNLMPYIESGATFVGHNIIGFDAHVLERVWDVVLPPSQVIDTLVLSRLYVPDLMPNHQLDTLGEKYLGVAKLPFDAYDDGYTEEMAKYLNRDLDITEGLYLFLLERMERWSQQSIDLEHEVQWYTCEQIRNGFMLDETKAVRLYAKMRNQQQEIENRLQEVFPPIVEERWSDKTGKRLKDKVTVFNPGSRKQIVERLEPLGARFVERTEKGAKKCDDSVLEHIDLPEAKLLLDYLSYGKLAPMIGSWIEAADEEGRVHGYVNTIGAITRRMSHSKPNLGQVPKRGDKGKRCRDCFTVADNMVLVGCDANSLEFRMLAHYLNDPEFTELVCQGAFHEFCMELLGIDNKDTSKTIEYAYLYGGQDPKLGSIVGGTALDGAELRARLEQGIPGLGDLIDRLKRIAKAGGMTLPSLDGGRTRVRSMHSILNTLLQGGGAIVMKQGLVLSERALRKEGLYPHQKLVVQVHDEFQRESEVDVAEQVGECMRQGIIQTADVLQLRCPLDAEIKIGKTWKDTH